MLLLPASSSIMEQRPCRYRGVRWRRTSRPTSSSDWTRVSGRSPHPLTGVRGREHPDLIANTQFRMPCKMLIGRGGGRVGLSRFLRWTSTRKGGSLGRFGGVEPPGLVPSISGSDPCLPVSEHLNTSPSPSISSTRCTLTTIATLR